MREFLSDLPVLWIPRVAPHKQRRGRVPRIPECHQVMAQLIIIERIACENQKVAHAGKREEVQPWVMRDLQLDGGRA